MEIIKTPNQRVTRSLFWSTTLVLPAALPEQIPLSAREALIIHELAHIQRGEVLVRWLQNLARLLFFFWPPVWLALQATRTILRNACDLWAIKLSSASPEVYAESLLNVAKGDNRSSVIPAT